MTNVSLKCFNTNADQFVNKRDDLLMMISDDRPNFILITEMIPKKQINPITDQLLDIDGYKAYYNFGPNISNLGTSGIRGVAIYVKETLNPTEAKILSEGYHDHKWIEIPTESEPLLIGCVYRSPSDDASKNECMESSKRVSRLIKNAVSKNENVLIAGDFNYKEINWIHDYAPPEKDHLTHFIETLHECYMYQHVTEPTRHRKDDTPSLLDLVLTSEEGMAQEIQYLPPLGESDHACLRFNVLTAQQKSESLFPSEPGIRKTNYASVRNELSKHSWEEELVSTFENDYNRFIDLLLSYVHKHSPLKIQPETRKNIFMTNAALRLRNKKYYY